MTEEDGPRRVTRYSVRPPSRFVGKGADFRLWIQRVELYFREADVPRDKRGQELASLLDDEPFRIVSQMGLLRVDSGIDYAAVKECLEKQFAPSGLQLEWQRKFHTGQQEQAESLIAFSARLRMPMTWSIDCSLSVLCFVTRGHRFTVDECDFPLLVCMLERKWTYFLSCRKKIQLTP